jgi:hypothetical protein
MQLRKGGGGGPPPYSTTLCILLAAFLDKYLKTLILFLSYFFRQSDDHGSENITVWMVFGIRTQNSGVIWSC